MKGYVGFTGTAMLDLLVKKEMKQSVPMRHMTFYN